MVFTMQYFLVRFANISISSNVSKGFIREMHNDIVLSFKLLFHWLPVSQFGHIYHHLVVNVLIFVALLTACQMTYLRTSLRKKLLLLLMRSSDVMEIFLYLLLSMSINRHGDFVVGQVQISGSHHPYLNCPWKKQYYQY